MVLSKKYHSFSRRGALLSLSLFMTKKEGDVSEVGVVDFSISILSENETSHPRVDILPHAILQ